MHYLYRYVCILNVFFYMCIWTIVCNKEFIILFRSSAFPTGAVAVSPSFIRTAIPVLSHLKLRT